jgi:exoribonuclease R
MVTTARIHIHDRNYSAWSFIDVDKNVELVLAENPALQQINPLRQKCFSKDVFRVTDVAAEPVYSSVKMNEKIAGVVVLESNKTFGRTEKGRLLYKCIPDDVHLPFFLVPFDVKMGFSKIQKNKYVVFTFDHWKNKHPQGVITETIGDIDCIESFYEYQLYCKSLYVSIADFTNKTREMLKQTSQEHFIDQIRTNPRFRVEDYRDKYVFTIDPPNSVDFDDGFSVETCETETVVTVYIANVFLWMETLGLWGSFSKRVATIYLPDRKRPMLPTILSDTLCSLQENQDRFAFAMAIRVDNLTGQIIGKPQYTNAVISVSKNYTYDDPKFTYGGDINYKILFELTAKLDKRVACSHDVVSFWMIYMNKMTAEYLLKRNTGIFRITVPAIFDGETDSNIRGETLRAIQSWNNNSGKYVAFGENMSCQHDGMKTEYIHITSPIRRLVDLLNQMILFRQLSMVSQMSKDAIDFLNHWLAQIDYINTTMRSIRKIQIDSFLLNRCFSEPGIVDAQYRGIVFDGIHKNDGMFHYMVYLEELKMLSRIVTHIELTNLAFYSFKLFLFENEDKTKKKIRLQIM